MENCAGFLKVFCGTTRVVKVLGLCSGICFWNFYPWTRDEVELHKHSPVCAPPLLEHTDVTVMLVNEATGDVQPP